MFGFLAFVSVLVIGSSAAFGVQHIYAQGLNDDCPALSELVADSVPFSGLRHGQSIFGIRDGRVMSELEANIPHIRVVSIERHFPNRVTINFVRRYERIGVAHGGRYYSVCSGLRVIGVSDITPNLIMVRSKHISAPILGEQLIMLPHHRRVLQEFVLAIQSFGYDQYGPNLIGYICLDTVGETWLQTHTGVRIRLIGYDDITDKLRLGLSILINTVSPIDRTSGVIIINSASLGGWTQ